MVMPDTPNVEQVLPVVGALAPVDLRKIWAHEAHVFTPWLAENIKLLSDALGVSGLQVLGSTVE